MDYSKDHMTRRALKMESTPFNVLITVMHPEAD